MLEDMASRIKMLLLDVDGVLTDGRITVNHKGEETKSFNVKDGLGLKTLLSEDVDVILITARQSQVVEHRAKQLGIQAVYQGVTDKRALCKRIKEEKGLKRGEICCMGDDLIDLGMFRESGMKIAVADAAKEVREEADFITERMGGLGAVREVCEIILKSQGKWGDAVARYAGE